jgi:hypothetical protein
MTSTVSRFSLAELIDIQWHWQHLKPLHYTPSSLARPRRAVTKAFLCEQIRQPRLVRLV